MSVLVFIFAERSLPPSLCLQCVIEQVSMLLWGPWARCFRDMCILAYLVKRRKILKPSRFPVTWWKPFLETDPALYMVCVLTDSANGNLSRSVCCRGLKFESSVFLLLGYLQTSEAACSNSRLVCVSPNLSACANKQIWLETSRLLRAPDEKHLAVTCSWRETSRCYVLRTRAIFSPFLFLSFLCFVPFIVLAVSTSTSSLHLHSSICPKHKYRRGECLSFYPQSPHRNNQVTFHHASGDLSSCILKVQCLKPSFQSISYAWKGSFDLLMKWTTNTENYAGYCFESQIKYHIFRFCQHYMYRKVKHQTYCRWHTCLWNICESPGER